MKSSQSGQHQINLGKTARELPASSTPPGSFSAAVGGGGGGDAGGWIEAFGKLGERIGELVDVVRREIRATRLTVYIALGILLANAGTNYLTVIRVTEALAQRVDEKVAAEADDLKALLKAVRENQRRIDRLLLVNSKATAQASKATEALAEAEAADTEPNPTKRTAKKHAAATRAMKASRAAQQIIRIDADGLDPEWVERDVASPHPPPMKKE